MNSTRSPGTRSLRIVVLLLALATGCARRYPVNLTWPAVEPERSPARQSSAGRLLLIGGAISPDNKDVYGHFIGRAREAAGGAGPRIVIATAAGGSEADSAALAMRTIRDHCRDCEIEHVARATPDDETARRIDAAHAMFFTGGDQKRIADRYLVRGREGERAEDGPAAAAMRRLLDRGGLIAGNSAGDAMMSDPMFLGGGSAAALGLAESRPARGESSEEERDGAVRSGPRLGQGMGFLPGAIADSHFFERDRFGRLVAALEVSGKRFGIGVSENAAVEYDIRSATLTGISEAPSLLVDASELARDGAAWRGIGARMIERGDRVRLDERRDGPPRGGQRYSAATEFDDVPEAAASRPGGSSSRPSRPRSRDFFQRAMKAPASRPARLRFDAYELVGWSDGANGARVEILPLRSASRPASGPSGSMP